jgi:hypothetical protein
MMSMINKKILTGLALLLMLVGIGSVFNNRDHHYTVDVIKSEQGWGYNILFDNKLIIHQPYMPAGNGQVAFGDKYSARKIGGLVVKKLQNNQSPSITRDELHSIIKNTNKVTY